MPKTKTATASNANSSVKLPKYLRLAKGLMWLDVYGDNPSGIRLYRNIETMAGRGNDVTEIAEVPKGDKKKKYGDKYPEYEVKTDIGTIKKPAIDKYKNQKTEEGTYGTIDTDEDNHKCWFCVDDINKDKLGNILVAYRNGILVEHDPKKDKLKVITEREAGRKNFRVQDGDVVFSGKNEHMYKLLMSSNFEKLKEFVSECGVSSKQNLMDLYQYEVKGFNKLNRSRIEVLDLIRDRLNSIGGGISPVRVNDLDD